MATSNAVKTVSNSTEKNPSWEAKSHWKMADIFFLSWFVTMFMRAQNSTQKSVKISVQFWCLRCSNIICPILVRFFNYRFAFWVTVCQKQTFKELLSMITVNYIPDIAAKMCKLLYVTTRIHSNFLSIQVMWLLLTILYETLVYYLLFLSFYTVLSRYMASFWNVTTKWHKRSAENFFWFHSCAAIIFYNYMI